MACRSWEVGEVKSKPSRGSCLPWVGGPARLLGVPAGWLQHFTSASGGPGSLWRPRIITPQHCTGSGAETPRGAPEWTVCFGPGKAGFQAFLQPQAGLTHTKPSGLCGCAGTHKDSTSAQPPACKGWGEGDTRLATPRQAKVAARQGSRERPLWGRGGGSSPSQPRMSSAGL